MLPKPRNQLTGTPLNLEPTALVVSRVGNHRHLCVLPVAEGFDQRCRRTAVLHRRPPQVPGHPAGRTLKLSTRTRVIAVGDEAGGRDVFSRPDANAHRSGIVQLEHQHVRAARPSAAPTSTATT